MIRRTVAILWRCLPLMLTLIFCGVLVFTVDTVEYDESIFLDVARNIRRHGLPIRSLGEGVYSFEHTPLYPYLVAFTGWTMPSQILFVRLLTTLFALATVELTYRIGREAGGKLKGGVAALLLALNPFFLVYSYFVRMEVPLVFFLVLATWALMAWQRAHAYPYLRGAGIALAIAVLLKEIALVFWGSVILAVGVWSLQQNLGSKPVLVVGTPAPIALGLWALWALNLEPQQWINNLQRWMGSAVGGGALIDPRFAVGLPKWFSLVGGTVLGWGTVVLLVIACASLLVRRRRMTFILGLCLIYISLALISSSFIQLKEPRYVIGIIPFVALFVALTVDWSFFLRASVGLRVIVAALVLLLIWNVSPLQLPFMEPQNFTAWWDPLFTRRAFEQDRYYQVLRATGRYLAIYSPPHEPITVVHEGPVVGYYADRPYYFLYTLPYTSSMAVLNETTYLVLDQPLFLNQTESEVLQTLEYIEEHFEVVQVVTEDARQVSVLKRR